MKIKNAKFIKSLAKFDANEVLLHSGVAFLGRSNVGKSSLINALTHQKNLAKSSSTPGKTRLINLFEIFCKENEQDFTLLFIDLPGFGYAKVSKSLKEQWDKSLNEFLQKENSIKLFVHLIDSRHENLELDKQVGIYLQSICKADQQILQIFTKSDKLNQSQRTRLKNSYPNALFVSSLKKQGLEELENLIILKCLGQTNAS